MAWTTPPPAGMKLASLPPPPGPSLTHKGARSCSGALSCAPATLLDTFPQCSGFLLPPASPFKAQINRLVGGRGSDFLDEPLEGNSEKNKNNDCFVRILDRSRMRMGTLGGVSLGPKAPIPPRAHLPGCGRR